MPFRTVDGETHLCLVTVDPDTSVETITYVFPGGDGTTKETAVQVSTFGRLIDADEDAEMSGKYIQVMNDIDIADESWYTGYISKNKYHNYIFATTNKKIQGITVVAQQGIIYAADTSSKCTFENISLLNWVLRCTATSGTAIFGPTTTDTTAAWITLLNFSLSARVIGNSANTIRIFGSHIFANDVSIYIDNCPTHTLQAISGTTSNTPNIKENINIVVSGGNVSCNYMFGERCRRMSVVIKDSNLTSMSSVSTANNVRSQQTYYAFSNCTFNVTTPVSVFSTNLNMIACDTTPYPFELASTSGNVTILATMVDETDPNFETSSIKSKQFLIDSGFLP